MVPSSRQAMPTQLKTGILEPSSNFKRPLKKIKQTPVTMKRPVHENSFFSLSSIGFEFMLKDNCTSAVVL
jgi:hypothetical protein